MPVYFVYRCHYGAPSEKHVRRFEYDTVLEWARAVWKDFNNDKEAYEYAKQLLGGLSVYSFGSLFYSAPEYPLSACPETMEDVHAWFGGMYRNENADGPHHVQILTDDDELELAVYVFDDHYRAANPGKADFLLLDGWELPSGSADTPLAKLPQTGAIEPAGETEGTLYAVSLFADDSCNLSDLCPAHRIEGLRLPDLARHLLLHPDEDALDWGLRETRNAIQIVLSNTLGEDAGFLSALREEPEERTHWAAYSDWLQEHELPPAGLHLLNLALRSTHLSHSRDSRNPAFDRVKVTPHMAQACKHEGRWYRKPMTDEITDDDTFVQFIFFDDRWAAAHPTLAAGILTFVSRWDVLS